MIDINDYVKQDKQLTEELSYESVIQKLQEAQEAGVPIEEGLFGAIVGGLTGATFGPKLGSAICSALGIDPKGTLGSLITSRLVLTAIGAKIGMKI